MRVPYCSFWKTCVELRNKVPFDEIAEEETERPGDDRPLVHHPQDHELA